LDKYECLHTNVTLLNLTNTCSKTCHSKVAKTSEDKGVGAGSPDNCGSGMSFSACGSGKAVASTGPVSTDNDHRRGAATVVRDIGGVKINNDSEDPRKTHLKCELGSYQSNNRMEAGGATGCLGLAQS
jgi:hypothetical protein